MGHDDLGADDAITAETDAYAWVATRSESYVAVDSNDSGTVQSYGLSASGSDAYEAHDDGGATTDATGVAGHDAYTYDETSTNTSDYAYRMSYPGESLTDAVAGSDSLSEHDEGRHADDLGDHLEHTSDTYSLVETHDAAFDMVDLLASGGTSTTDHESETSDTGSNTAGRLQVDGTVTSHHFDASESLSHSGLLEWKAPGTDSYGQSYSVDATATSTDTYTMTHSSDVATDGSLSETYDSNEVQSQGDCVMYRGLGKFGNRKSWSV